MKAKQKIKIAGCYIVRNEAAVLGRSLASMADQVDEIVVVDTGSTDDTAAIAASYGARVVAHPWQENFSEARNFALDQLTADWVVFLDADEYFTEATKGNLRREIEAADAAGHDLLLLQWRNIDADTGAHLVDVYTPRIFRCLPALRYVGRIHEQLRENGGLVRRTSLVPEERLLLIHTGYSTHLTAAKAQRNLKLLLADLAESPAPETLYMALAEAYDGVGDEAMALQYAYMDIANGRQASTYASRSYRLLLRRLAARPAAFEERREVARRAVEDFPELPEFHAEYAECLAYIFDYEGAEGEAARAIAAFDAYDSLEPLQFDAAMRSVVAERRRLWAAIRERQQGIKISAVLIARDAAADMPLWLANAAVYSDERIVVDTGSEDETASLAAAAGAKVFAYEWQEDFAAARNFALAEAQGDWIAVLDADERFLQPERVRPLLAEIEVMHPAADAVRVMIVNVDEDDGGREIQRFMAVRLLRRREGLSYVGRVHETLAWRDGRPLAAHDEKYRLLVQHTGYSAGRMMKKARRNLALLQADIAAAGEGAQHYRYLAECYATLGAPEKALYYAKLAIEAPLQAIGSQSDMYYLVLQCLRWLERPSAERLAAALAAQERFPLRPEYHVAAGELWALQGEREKAKRDLLRALALYRRPEDDSGEAAHFSPLTAGRMYRQLAAIDWQEGRKEMADERLEEALRLNRYDEEALNLFCEMQSEKTAVELAAELRKFFPSGEADLQYLLRWSEQNGWIRIYQALAARLQAEFGKTAPRLELYEKAQRGEMKEVYEAVAEGLAECFPQLVTSLILLEKRDGIEELQLCQRCLQLLPPATATVWQAYQGEDIAYGEDGFSVMLPIFLRYGDEEQITRLGLLAGAFSPEKLYETAKQVMAEERWGAAFTLFSQLPGESSVITARFWTEMGICLYHLQEWESAAECFEQAVEMGGETPEIASYRAWLKEAQSRG